MEVEVHAPEDLPAAFKRKPPGPRPGSVLTKNGQPYKRRGPKPKPVEYKERKPLKRKEKRYNLKRKQEVVLFLIHHRVEDVDRESRVSAPRARSGMSGSVEAEPRIIDGVEKWFRPPTYEETSDFWKIPKATISTWWSNKEKILGDIPITEPKIPLVSAIHRRRLYHPEFEGLEGPGVPPPLPEQPAAQAPQAPHQQQMQQQPPQPPQPVLGIPQHHVVAPPLQHGQRPLQPALQYGNNPFQQPRPAQYGHPNQYGQPAPPPPQAGSSDPLAQAFSAAQALANQLDPTARPIPMPQPVPARSFLAPQQFPLAYAIQIGKGLIDHLEWAIRAPQQVQAQLLPQALNIVHALSHHLAVASHTISTAPPQGPHPGQGYHLPPGHHPGQAHHPQHPIQGHHQGHPPPQGHHPSQGQHVRGQQWPPPINPPQPVTSYKSPYAPSPSAQVPNPTQNPHSGQTQSSTVVLEDDGNAVVKVSKETEDDPDLAHFVQRSRERQEAAKSAAQSPETQAAEKVQEADKTAELDLVTGEIQSEALAQTVSEAKPTKSAEITDDAAEKHQIMEGVEADVDVEVTSDAVKSGEATDEAELVIMDDVVENNQPTDDVRVETTEKSPPVDVEDELNRLMDEEDETPVTVEDETPAVEDADLADDDEAMEDDNLADGDQITDENDESALEVQLTDEGQKLPEDEPMANAEAATKSALLILQES